MYKVVKTLRVRHFALISIVLLFSSTAFAQQTYDTEFTQTKTMKVSGKTTEKAGHIIFDGNDHLAMTYSEPEGEYFIIDGNNVKIHMDGKKADLDADKVKMVKLQRSTLLNCLAGNWEQAAEDNAAELTITEEDDMKIVSIIAKGKVPKGGYKSVIMSYRLSDGQLTKMVLEEAIGSINTYEMK